MTLDVEMAGLGVKATRLHEKKTRQGVEMAWLYIRTTGRDVEMAGLDERTKER